MRQGRGIIGNDHHTSVRACAASLLLFACVRAAAEPYCAPLAEREALHTAALAGADSQVQSDVRWQHAVDAARPCNVPEEVATLLSQWSDASRRLGATDRIVELEQRRAELAQAQGLLAHEADARIKIGMIAVGRGDLPHAFTQFDTARDRYERASDLAGAARAYTELSRLERRRGDYLAALRFELTSLQLRRRVDPPLELWRSLLSLAALYEQIELFDESRKYYADALAEAERGDVPQQIGDALNGYAGFLNDFGSESAPSALSMAARANALFAGLSDPARIGSSLLQIGRAQVGLRDYDAAEQAFARALQIAQEGSFDALRAHVEFRWGEVRLARGDIDGARERIGRAREVYEQQGNRHRLVKVYGVLEKLHAQRGDALAAAAAGREHFRLRNELLGANATGKLGELLTNFALVEERHRNDALERENAVNAVRLESERRLRLLGYVGASLVIAALLLLMWRHMTVRRLYALLREQTRETEAQRAALARANARLTRLNITDSLTGLSTRAHGLERLADLLTHARERGIAPALLLLDMDNFKDINDRYGHLAGDQALIAVAHVLVGMTPDDGLAVRAGGEEFLLILEHADHDRAFMLADAVRRRVRDLAVDIGPAVLQLSVSIGIAHANAMSTVRELFTAADHALYDAKDAGRDCVRRAT